MTITETGEQNKGYLEEIEAEVYAASMAAGRAALLERLNELDDTLASSRDRSIYRDKGKRRSVQKTRLGEAEYERRVYERQTA